MNPAVDFEARRGTWSYPTAVKNLEYTIAKAYAIDAMLGSGFDTVNRDPEVQEAWSKWTDVELNLEQWAKASAMRSAWS